MDARNKSAHDGLRTEQGRPSGGSAAAGGDGRYRDPACALFRHCPGILARRNTPSPCPLPRHGGEVEIGTAIERDVQPRAGLAA